MADGDQPAEGRQPEDPEPVTVETARHWAAFYAELIDYEERILDSMRELSIGMSADEMKAVRKTNLEPLEQLIEDFQRRLALWRARLLAEETDPGEGGR
jgi:hypothetical protein